MPSDEERKRNWHYEQQDLENKIINHYMNNGE